MITSKVQSGNIGYLHICRDTEVANNGTITVNHADDPERLRKIRVYSFKTASFPAGPDNASPKWSIASMTDLQTVITNLSGAMTRGAAVAGAGNTGSATTPTSSGTYTGKVDGNIVVTGKTDGELGTATVDVLFPDGTLVEDLVSGVTTVAKLLGQGVSLALTSGAGDDVKIGDTWTIAVTAAYSDIQVVVETAGG